MFTRKDIMFELENTSEKDLFPIFVPTYNRMNDLRVEDKIFSHFNEEAYNKIQFVVREEQYKQYKRSYPMCNYLVIPKGQVSGLGSTRNFIIDYCVSHRIPYAIDMDDDIKYISYIFVAISQSGEKTSHHSLVTDVKKDPLLYQKVFQLACKISKDLFRSDKYVVLGNIRRQHFSNDLSNSQTKYQVNKGITPRQIKILNIKQLYKKNIRVPEEFDIHGEDIGFVAEVLRKGCKTFNIPCLSYDYVDEKTNSVVRDPKGENRELHRMEFEGLMKMPIKDYLKWTIKFPDGEYRFGDVDWRKYHKLNGTQGIRVGWEE